MPEDLLETLYIKQYRLQMQFKDNRKIPSVKEMYNSATAMIVEIGEMLQSDKRWKNEVLHTGRSADYNRDEFLKEYADVFIYLLNVGIYAGLLYDEIINAVTSKIYLNYKRFEQAGLLKEIGDD